jgi:hypothetical protein
VTGFDPDGEGWGSYKFELSPSYAHGLCYFWPWLATPGTHTIKIRAGVINAGAKFLLGNDPACWMGFLGYGTTLFTNVGEPSTPGTFPQQGL